MRTFNMAGFVTGSVVASMSVAALATTTNARAIDVATIHVPNDASAIVEQIKQKPKPSATLREYSQSNDFRKDTLIYQTIVTLIRDYRSPVNRAGQLKARDVRMANLNVAIHIESLFLRGTRKQRDRNYSAVMEFLELRSERVPETTVEKTILTFIELTLEKPNSLNKLKGTTKSVWLV
jgi:hypothetical protein